MIFFKQIFTWWNRQTLGTMILTIFTGRFKGKDQLGNKYYENRKGKRWVIYSGVIDASKIPPEWHLWIHFLTNKVPDNSSTKYEWEKEHQPNMTGTESAYRPKKIIESKDIKKKYETWKI